MANSSFRNYCIAYKRCRWNSVTQTIAVSLDKTKLMLLSPEVEKPALLAPKEIHDSCKYFTWPFPLQTMKFFNWLSIGITWIEWSGDGRLLASCADDNSVRIFDPRHCRVVRIFRDLHKGKIQS